MAFAKCSGIVTFLIDRIYGDKEAHGIFTDCRTLKVIINAFRILLQVRMTEI